ncbi:MAG: signal recognition particle subunit SRP19/SEC65 family protein [Candidatus Thermoplasmatota archaeon]
MKTRARRQVLWPAYFDLRLSRGEGRRVSKGLAVDNPTAEEILTAAQRCGFDAEIEKDKAYPPQWWKGGGRVLLQKAQGKEQLLALIASEMRRARGR